MDELSATPAILPCQPPDGVAPYTLWTSQFRHELRILERDGEKFRANFREGSFIELDVYGTIRAGLLRWDAKDVRAIKPGSGGAGGDCEGTVLEDRIDDFQYRNHPNTRPPFVNGNFDLVKQVLEQKP